MICRLWIDFGSIKEDVEWPMEAICLTPLEVIRTLILMLLANYRDWRFLQSNQVSEERRRETGHVDI